MARFLSIKSFRMKLLFIIWVGSTATLFLASGCFIFFEVGQFNKDSTKDMKIIASFIADKSTPAIMFNDPVIAEDALLSAAATDPAIVNAVVYDAKGNVVATYARDISGPTDFEIPEPQQNTSFIKDSHLHVFSDIDMYSDRLGTIYIQADRHELHKRIRSYGVIVAGIMAVSLFFIAVISFVLQKLVSTPIMALAASAKQVSEKKDYSIRVKKQSEDELGVLADSFNEMLSQIQKRDSALRQSEGKHRELTENLPQKIFHKDARLVYVSCNKHYARDLGIGPEEIAGKTDFDFYPDELAEKYRADDRRVMESGQTEEFEECYLKNGEKLFTQTVKTPLTDEAGAVRGILGIFWDITDRKRAERERERLVKTLEFKNRELQDIVYTASHDLRSPLVNIEGFGGELKSNCGQLLEMVAEQAEGKDNRERIEVLLEEDIPESLHFIIGGIRKMNNLLDGLLQVSRIGTVEINSRSIDMNAMMSEALAAMEYQIKENDIAVTVDSLESCIGDASMLDNVFTNLIGNAIKYGDPAGKSEIRISGEVNGDMNIYCVADNGMGIAPGHQEKVFEIFHRLNPDDAMGGEGLGLTIVTRILDRLGGNIRLESEPGKGSKFFVTLPKVFVT